MPVNPTPAEGVVVPDFADYRRSQIASLRPYVEGEALSDRVSISAADREAGSPKAGDMIARNPANHDDQWLVAADYFAANFEPARPAAPTQSVAQTGEVECEVCKRGEVRHFSMDDGFWVEITTSAGGANEHGLNGWIETLEHYPDGLTKRREYVATDSPALSTIPARPAAPTQSAAQTGEVDATLIEAQAAEIEEARKVIATINRVLSPQADRTFDLLISQSQWAVDTCRAFLASRTERAATQTTPASPPDGP